MKLDWDIMNREGGSIKRRLSMKKRTEMSERERAGRRKEEVRCIAVIIQEAS